jgi:hypothetical protein
MDSFVENQPMPAYSTVAVDSTIVGYLPQL